MVALRLVFSQRFSSPERPASLGLLDRLGLFDRRVRWTSVICASRHLDDDAGHLSAAPFGDRIGINRDRL